MSLENTQGNKSDTKTVGQQDNSVVPTGAILVFFVSLLVRLIGIFSVQVIGFDPFGGGQAGGHAHTAAEIASTGLSYEIDFSNTFDRWGLLLSPFWLLPGPSEIYAHIAVAIVGSLAILNVYLICEHYHSKQAGYLAVTPLALLPSYAFMHAVLQREALLLFSVTTAFVLIFLPNRYISYPRNYLLAVLCLIIAGYLRRFNIPVILSVGAIVVLISLIISGRYTPRRMLYGILTTVSVSIVGLYFAITNWITDLQNATTWLATLRARRARGRATYLTDIIPANFFEFFAFSWIGAFYFLFAPFPWHFEVINDLPGLIESAIGLVFLIFSFTGIKTVGQKSPVAVITLIAALVVYSVLYGYGTANYGTALRHRQAVFWIILVFGAIGISQRTRFKL